MLTLDYIRRVGWAQRGGNLMGRNHSGRLGVNRIILKLILKETESLGWIQVAQD
jgi:hypothetical protein